MNMLAVVILAALLLDKAIRFTADILNLRQLRTELPPLFAHWYDPLQYRRAQLYVRVNTRFGWLTETVALVAVLAFWFGGGFAFLYRLVSSFGFSPILSGVIYIGILAGAKTLLDQPFNAFAVFGIEARFGFNKTTWKTYLLDRLKAIFLGALLGGALLAAVIYFFQYSGPAAWLWCWLATVAFMLLMHYVAPTWIMPLFNRFDPLPEGELRDAITDYARSIDFSLQNIFVMDGSKRSTKANAFFTGFGSHRRIVLFDTLIQQHTVAELVAVLAHEMGHYRHQHVLKMMLLSIMQVGLMFYLLSWFISYPGLFQAFGLSQVSVYAGLVFFGILYEPIDTFAGMLVHAVSRKYEYDADRFAVVTAPQGHSLASALKKLSVGNLANLQPHPFYVALHYSHPPVMRRIEAIEAAIRSEKNSGTKGKR